MKKTLLLAIMATMFLSATNAQTVITNDYGSSSVTSAASQDADDRESFSAFGIGYYGFDGFHNWALNSHFLTPNGVGFDFNIRANFEKYGNYNADFGVNYSFQLWGQDDKRLLLTAAIGPSLRMQDDWEDKTHYYIDLFVNPRLAFNISRFTISAGYFLWGAKFKLGDDYRADGFNVSVGYDI